MHLIVALAGEVRVMWNLRPMQGLLIALFLSFTLSPFGSASTSSGPRYLITNEDKASGNSATVFTVSPTGVLTVRASIPTGGSGFDGGGYPEADKIIVSDDSAGDCAFLSDSIPFRGYQHPDVTGISLATMSVTGNYLGSFFDQATEGMALAANASYLYAYFNASGDIGTFQKLPGCKLQFLSDVTAAGLNQGQIVSIHIRNQMLVATFSDGSIESFNVSSGPPVPNGDLQYSTGHAVYGYYPGPIDMTTDGRYAIIGDTGSSVEVSDLSSGKLAPTVVYSRLGAGSFSDSVWLSPDETLLYIGDFDAGRVSAARFDKDTGTLSPGCISRVLKDRSKWTGVATVRSVLPMGTGSGLYVVEPDPFIAVVQVQMNGNSCSLTELNSSPTHDPNAWTLESIGVFPPRHF